MGASGSQAAAGQQSAKCQGCWPVGSALRAPAPLRISLRLLPRPEVPCAPSQMGTLAKDGLEALRQGGFVTVQRTPMLSSKRQCQPPALPL